MNRKERKQLLIDTNNSFDFYYFGNRFLRIFCVWSPDEEYHRFCSFCKQGRHTFINEEGTKNIFCDINCYDNSLVKNE